MGLDYPTAALRMQAMQPGILPEVLSSMIGAMFTVAFFSEVRGRNGAGEVWPEPSRIEWEDTQ